VKDQEAHEGSDPPALAISNAIVKITRDYTGRGPTKARTHVTGDLVSVIMQDTLTRGERKLAQNGKGDLVREVRRTFQDTMRQEMSSAVEEATGREVVAFMSDNHIDPDVAIEAFVLKAAP
jgi:uncharacterized protein YbcI